MKNIPLHSEEMIMKSLHQSKAVLAKPVTIGLIALIFPWSQAIKYGVGDTLRSILFFWSAGVILYVLREVVMWNRIHYIITSKRLIKLSHESVFKRVVMETPLDRILNVSYKTTGFWSSLLGFGDVEVQVVGLMEPMVLAHVKKPAKLKDYLWQAHERSTKLTRRFESEEISHIQQQIGYTKKDQRIL